jgi:hypothetical protein
MMTFRPWKYTINIAAEHAAYQAEEIDVPELGRQVAAKIQTCQAYRSDRSLRGIADQFAALNDNSDINDYDNILAELYNWGDWQKTCWIETIRTV